LSFYLLTIAGTAYESSKALAADKKLPQSQTKKVKKDSWDPDNFTLLWQSCKRNSMRTFFKQLDQLGDKYSEEMTRQPRDEESERFASESYDETGRILFASRLPQDYPFRDIFSECWTSLYGMRVSIVQDNNIKFAREAADLWKTCIGASYRKDWPPVAKRLEECFTNMGLLDKRKK
jgi:hypothetical protein